MGPQSCHHDAARARSPAGWCAPAERIDLGRVDPLLAVTSGDDVGLNRVLGCVARVARDDATLVERADAQVGAAARFAAVSPASEDDRALLLHGAVAAPRQRTLE